MRQLKQLTYHGVTSYYYKQDIRVPEQPADAFWMVDKPFLYNQRYKGKCFRPGSSGIAQKPVLESRASNAEIAAAERLLLDIKKQKCLAGTANQQLANCTAFKATGNYMNLSRQLCNQLKKEAAVYLRHLPARQQFAGCDASENYNGELINTYYENIDDILKCDVHKLFLAQKLKAIVYHIQVSKIAIRERIKHCDALSDLLESRIQLKIDILRSKVSLSLKKFGQ